MSSTLQRACGAYVIVHVHVRVHVLVPVHTMHKPYARSTLYDSRSGTVTCNTLATYSSILVRYMHAGCVQAKVCCCVILNLSVDDPIAGDD